MSEPCLNRVRAMSEPCLYHVWIVSESGHVRVMSEPCLHHVWLVSEPGHISTMSEPYLSHVWTSNALSVRIRVQCPARGLDGMAECPVLLLHLPTSMSGPCLVHVYKPSNTYIETPPHDRHQITSCGMPTISVTKHVCPDYQQGIMMACLHCPDD